MEKDTVVLGLKEYNELRDFRNEIKKGHTCRVFNGLIGSSIKYIGVDEALKEMSEKLKDAHNEIVNLQYPNKKQPSINEIKAMNWLEFRKWKKNN